jgi:hypothetical protein
MRGRIPQTYWVPAIEAAAAEGDSLELADFLNEHTVEGDEESAA